MLYYLQSRYYDPNTGRFLNADDTDELDNSKDSVLSPNLYAYCDNNPVVRTDEEGHFWFLVALAAVISPEALIVAFGVLAIVAIGYTVGSYLHNQRLFRDSYIHYAKTTKKSSKKAKSSGHIDKQRKGTPKNNKAQNKQTNDASKRYKLNKGQQRELHDRVTHQNYTYQEILEIAKEIKEGR